MRYQLQDSTMIILQLLASYFILQNISKFSSASGQVIDVNNVHVLPSIKKGKDYSSSIFKNFNPDLLFLRNYGIQNRSRKKREIIRLPPHKAFHEFNYEPVLPRIAETDQNTPESAYPDGDRKVSDEKVRTTSGNVPSRSGLPNGDRRGRRRKPTRKVISRSKKTSRVQDTGRRRTQRPRPTSSQEHTGSTKGPTNDLLSQTVRLPSHKAFHDFHYQTVNVKPPDFREDTPFTTKSRITTEKSRTTEKPDSSRYPDTNNRRITHRPTPSRNPTRRLGTAKPIRIPSHKAFHDFHQQPVKITTHDSATKPTRTDEDDRHTTRRPQTQRKTKIPSQFPDGDHHRITERPRTTHRQTDSVTRKVTTAKPSRTSVRIPPHKAFHDFHHETIKIINPDVQVSTSAPSTVHKPRYPDGDHRVVTSSPEIHRTARPRITSQFPDENNRRGTRRPLRRRPTSSVTERPINQPKRDRIPPHKAFHDFHYQNVKIKPPDGHSVINRPKKVSRPRYPDGIHPFGEDIYNKTQQPGTPSRYPDGDHTKVTRRPSHGLTEFSTKRTSKPISGRIPPHKAFHDFHYESVKDKTRELAPKVISRPRYPDGNHRILTERPQKRRRIPKPRFPDSQQSGFISHELTDLVSRRPVTAKPPKEEIGIPPHRAFHEFHYETVNAQPSDSQNVTYSSANLSNIYNTNESFPVEERAKPRFPDGYTDIPLIMIHGTKRPVTSKSPNRRRGSKRPKSGSPLKRRRVNSKSSKPRTQAHSTDFPDIPSDIATINPLNIDFSTSAPVVSFRTIYPNGDYSIELQDSRITHRKPSRSGNRRFMDGKHVIVDRPRFSSGTDHRLIKKSPVSERQESSVTKAPIRFPPHEAFHAFHSEPVRPIRITTPSYPGTGRTTKPTGRTEKTTRTPRVKTTKSYEKTTRPSREKITFREKTTSPYERTTRHRDKTTRSREKTTRPTSPYDRTTKPRDKITKTTSAYDRTTRPREKTTRPTYEKTTSRDKITRPTPAYERTTRPRDKTTRFREKTTRPTYDKTTPREKTTRPTYEKTTPRDKSTRPTPAYERTTKPRDKITKTTTGYERTTRPRDKTTRFREKTTRPIYDKTTPRDKTTRPTPAYDRTTRPRDKTTRFREKTTRPTPAYDRTTKPRDKITKTTSAYDRTTRPRDKTTKTTSVYDRTTKPRDKITKTTTVYDRTTRPRDRTTRPTPAYDRTTRPRDRTTRPTSAYDRTTRPREKTTKPQEKTTRPVYDRTTKTRDKTTRPIYDKTTKPTRTTTDKVRTIPGEPDEGRFRTASPDGKKTTTERPIRFPPHKAFHEFHNEPVRIRNRYG